jgi:hypothetical protein
MSGEEDHDRIKLARRRAGRRAFSSRLTLTYYSSEDLCPIACLPAFSNEHRPAAVLGNELDASLFERGDQGLPGLGPASDLTIGREQPR